MATQTERKLEITRVLPAARERVFRAWTEAAQMKQWSCPEGAKVVDCSSTPEAGGAYHITMDVGEGLLVTARGVYREVTPHERLVYTWDWDEEDHAVGETLVTVEFRDMGDATEIVLTHDLFPAVEARDGHEQGWASCLNNLERLVS